MSDRRAVLEQIEAKLEAGKHVAHDADALFPLLGAGIDEEIEFFEVADWDDDADVALFLHVRGTYGLYRMSDSYLNRSCADFIEAFPWLYAHGDLGRATRAFARYLRASAYAETAPKFSIAQARGMFDALDVLRDAAPPPDVEELDLSIVEMFGRMAGSEWIDRDSLIFIYDTIRPTLTRLLVSPPTRQQAVPYASIGFWLNADMLWTDDDLEDVKRTLGETERQALRRTAYMVACELEDGSFYRVGSHPGEEDRKRTNLARHLTNVLTQSVTLGDEAGVQAAIARWAGILGTEAIETALDAARRDAEPESVGRPSPAPIERDVDESVRATRRAGTKRSAKQRVANATANKKATPRASAKKRASAKARAKTKRTGAKADSKTRARSARVDSKAKAGGAKAATKPKPASAKKPPRTKPGAKQRSANAKQK